MRVRVVSDKYFDKEKECIKRNRENHRKCTKIYLVNDETYFLYRELILLAKNCDFEREEILFYKVPRSKVEWVENAVEAVLLA